MTHTSDMDPSHPGRRGVLVRKTGGINHRKADGKRVEIGRACDIQSDFIVPGRPVENSGMDLPPRIAKMTVYERADESVGTDNNECTLF